MADRLKAEQVLCDTLYQAGILHSDAEMTVRRTDFKSPFYVFMDGKEIGVVEYHPKKNRFKNFQAIKPRVEFKRERIKAKVEVEPKLSVIDYLKTNKITIR